MTELEGILQRLGAKDGVPLISNGLVILKEGDITFIAPEVQVQAMILLHHNEYPTFPPEGFTWLRGDDLVSWFFLPVSTIQGMWGKVVNAIKETYPWFKVV